MNLLVYGVMATQVGVKLWRNAIGVARAPTFTHQTYVTRILQFERVSRIRYVSDTDTYPIRHGYVFGEYSFFLLF